jgi:2-iminobutanoate/2-iminopropanoate deaminase
MDRSACLGLALAAAATTPLAEEKPKAKHRRIRNWEGAYDNAREVSAFSRLVFVSGQVPLDANFKTVSGFKEQARQTWANVKSALADAGLGFEDMVKVTIFLADRKHIPELSEVRRELALNLPAMTIIITGIYHPDWLLEIEAIAAA